MSESCFFPLFVSIPERDYIALKVGGFRGQQYGCLGFNPWKGLYSAERQVRIAKRIPRQGGFNPWKGLYSAERIPPGVRQQEAEVSIPERDYIALKEDSSLILIKILTVSIPERDYIALKESGSLKSLMYVVFKVQLREWLNNSKKITICQQVKSLKPLLWLMREWLISWNGL